MMEHVCQNGPVNSANHHPIPPARGELDLHWLLRQTRLRLRPLVDRPARFCAVHTTELLHPGEFLPSGSIVLSLGMVFAGGAGGVASAEPAHPWADYAHHLAEHGVVAVGFGTGLVFDAVPEGLVAACREAGLALFEVPRATAFLSITSAVAEEQGRRARRQREELARMQSFLTARAVAQGMTGLCEQLAESLDAEVAVVDNDGRVVGKVGESAVELAVAHIARGRHEGSLAPGTMVFHMTRYGHRHHVMGVRSRRLLGEADRALIKHAASLADILQRRSDALVERENRLLNHALALHVGAAPDASALHTILARVADGAGRIRPILLHAEQPARVRRAERAAREQLRRENRSCATLAVDPTTTLLVLRGSRGVDSALSLLEGARGGVRVFVGEPMSLEALSGETVERLAMMCRTVPLGEWAATTSHDWLRDSAVAAALDAQARDTWDVLAAHDREHGTDLCGSLAAWARAGTNVGAAAELAGVHRHTMRRRLASISELCGVDLADPLSIAELLLVVATRPAPHASGQARA